MQYDVRALRQNSIVSVRVEAINNDDALSQVVAQSLRPLSVRIAGSRFTHGGRFFQSRFPIVLFSQELLALLEGGLTIVEAVEVLREKETRPAIKSLYGGIARGLTEGKSFSACLTEHPELFSSLYVGIVRSAETTSSLVAALTRFIEYQTRLDAVRGKVVSASIYPAILGIVGLGVIVFLSTYVVPRFASVYQGSGRPLPIMSRWLLAWGRFAEAHPTELIACGLLAAFAGVLAFKSLRARGGFGALLRHIPFFAERIKIYELSRVYLTLGMLLEGGLPITQALALSRGTLGVALRGAMDEATRAIMNGESLPNAFEHAGLTTPVAARFIRVGEKSGRLGEMLNRSARYYDGEISRWIDRFSRIFEPVLMTAIGVIVGLIVVLLYMPIFDLAGSFQQ